MFSVVGPTVRVEGCVPPAFDTGSAYEFSVNIGALSAGPHSIEYYDLDCGPPGQPGNPTGPLTLKATLDFVVLSAGAAVPPIPTLQSGSIVALVLLVALAGILVYRRRALARRV
jgi:hypothetical protein